MNEQKSMASSISTLIGSGALIAGISWWGLSGSGKDQMVDLESTSPVAALDDFPAVKGMRSYAASRWNDPFRHAEVARKELSGDDDRNSDIEEVIASKLEDSGRIMSLTIPLHGGDSFADTEIRRRRRHAIELALSNQGFTLSFPDRMSFRLVDLEYHFTPRSSASNSKRVAPRPIKQTVSVPTKLYKHERSNAWILVSWVDETLLGRRPIDVIDDIHRDLLPSKEDAAFCLLGPTWSGTLRELIRDGKEYDGKFFSDWGHGVICCNVTCTASDERLGLQSGQRYIRLGNYDARLIHTINSDRQLLKELRHEIEIRGVWPSTAADERMVLFVEQSSRSYINELRSHFDEARGNSPVIIPFLKGLAEADDNRRSVEDYLDRSMADLVTPRRAAPVASRRVRLVGIVGSSWEDKNLILEKARAAFPVATFFTTELDTRYSKLENIQHGRNLIVASHYGLRVDGRRDLFGRVASIPSFRDGYQTSIFIGASIACRAFLEERLKDEHYELTFGKLSQNLYDVVGRQQTDIELKNSNAYLHPLVFEIGNRSPILLRSENQAGIDYLPLRQPQGIPSVHERSWLIAILLISFGIVVIVFNAIAAYSSDAKTLQLGIVDGAKRTFSFMQKFFTGGYPQSISSVWPLTTALALGGLIVFVMIASDSSAESEPILIREGVSIWPSIWGLYLVIAFSLYSLRGFSVFSSKVQREEAKPQHRYDAGALKLATTLLVGFYLISYFESGLIPPPARDWIVRWLASGILFLATGCVLLTACRSLLHSLAARMKIRGFVSDLNEAKDSPQRQVERCLETMLESTATSREILTPALLSLLFLVSRLQYWDSWGLDRSWYVLLGTPIVICFIAAIIVRTTAIEYRNRVVDTLQQQNYRALIGVERKRAGARQLEYAIEEIKRLNRGPFGPITHDYLLGAAALIVAIAVTGPLGGLLNRLLLYIA